MMASGLQRWGQWGFGIMAMSVGIWGGAIAPAAAQAIPVNNCTEAGLRAALQSLPDGGTIELNCPRNTTIGMSQELVLNKAVTIIGQNAAIALDGRNRTRILRTTKNLTLQNLTLANGRVGNKVGNFSCEGGAVHVTFGQLRLDGVTLRNNFAPRGGAVCGNWQAQVEIRNSQFENNTAHQGGALYTNTSDLQIHNSTFTRNATTAGQGLTGNGGAIYTFANLNKRSPILIRGSRFEGNKGFNEGGAAFITQSNGVQLTLQDSTFVNNHAQLNRQTGIGSGGALKLAHNGGAATAQVQNVVFANNIADQEGGAVWAGGSNANLTLQFRQVTFANNEAGRIPDPQKNETAGGGILFNTQGRITFEQTTFTQNRAGNETSGAIAVISNFGGGLVNHNNVRVVDSIFDRNCSLKDLPGTPKVENCHHFVHARTAQRTGNNQFTARPFQGNNNVFEWIANIHDPLGQAFPVTAQSQVRNVNVRNYRDNGDAAPDHPCSDVRSGSGGACR